MEKHVLKKFLQSLWRMCCTFPPWSLSFSLFDSSTGSPHSDTYSELEVEDIFPPFKWKENLGKIILCMNFFCDTSWVRVADFCSRVALWPFFKHLRLSSEVHWMWWDMILKYGAFKKKSSKYIIFSARHVSHCQDESRLNAKFLVNCIYIVGLYSQSNTLAVCVQHIKLCHFIMGYTELWILRCEVGREGVRYASYMLITSMRMALRAAERTSEKTY